MRQKYLILLLSFPLLLQGQDGFIQTYTLDHPATLFTNIALHDEDTFVVTGIAAMDTFPYTQGITFTKLDTFGNVIDHTFLLDSLGADYSFGDTPRGIVKVNDNSGYLLLGHVFNRANVVAIKLNNNGEQLWVKEYPDTNSLQDLNRKLIEVNDGFLITGIKQALNYSTNIFIKKINHEGEELWERLYGVGNERADSFGDILIKNNNEFVIGGSHTSDIGVPWQDADVSAQIFAIDSLGNQKWYWESERSLEELWIRGLNFDDEGNWIYTTVKGKYRFDGALTVQPKLMIRDSSFNIIKENVLTGIFGGSEAFLLRSLIPISSGGWLGAGATIDSTENINIDGHIAGWTIKFDESGETVWERKDEIFPDSVFFTFQYLNSVIELSSGSFIAAGYYRDTNPDTRDWGILVKIDKHGCMDTLNCSLMTSVGTDDFLPEVIKVFPNPTSDLVHFYNSNFELWDKIELFDLSGKKVKEINNQNTIQLQDLVSGMYIAKIWKGGKFQVKKILKK